MKSALFKNIARPNREDLYRHGHSVIKYSAHIAYIQRHYRIKINKFSNEVCFLIQEFHSVKQDI